MVAIPFLISAVEQETKNVRGSALLVLSLFLPESERRLSWVESCKVGVVWILSECKKLLN